MKTSSLPLSNELTQINYLLTKPYLSDQAKHGLRTRKRQIKRFFAVNPNLSDTVSGKLELSTNIEKEN